MGVVSADFDILKIHGTDPNGVDCIYLIFHSLAPDQTRKLAVIIKSNDKTIQKSPSKIYFTIIGYSKTEPQILSKEGMVAYPFRPPEKIKVKGVSIRMKKK